MFSLPERVEAAIMAVINSTYRDVEPQLSCLPQQVHQPERYYDSTGPLGALRRKLYKLVKPLRTDEGKRIEKEHWKWYARNIISCVDRLTYTDNIDYFPKCRKVIAVDTFERCIRKLGLGKSSGVKLKISRFTSPPKYEASNGVTYDPVLNRLFTSKKGDSWAAAINSARKRHQRIVKDERLDWDMPLATIYQIVKEYCIWYVMFFRFDNPHWKKPRNLLGSQVDDYIEQRTAAEGLKIDIKKSPYFATDVYKVAIQSQCNRTHGHDRYLTLDHKRYDHHQDPRILWNLRRAISNIYSENEAQQRVDIFNAIANIYAPIAVPTESGFRWQQRAGMASSGAGDFSEDNSVLAQVLNILVALEVEPYLEGLEIEDIDPDDLGCGLGDNTYVPTQVGANVWAKAIAEYGFELKPSETLDSKRIIVMLKNIFDLQEGGWEPVVLNLAHKALTSAELDLSYKQFTRTPAGYRFSRRDKRSRILAYKVALGQRARGAIVGSARDNALNASRGRQWDTVFSWWKEHIAKEELLMLEYSDTELSQRLQQLLPSTNFLMKISQIKKRYGIGDTSNFFL